MSSAPTESARGRPQRPPATSDLRALVLALDAERDDPDPAVRRRVVDRFAAMARTHPTLALATAARWNAEGGRHTPSVVRRGLAPLVQRRDPTALRLAGYAPEAAVRVRELVLDAPKAALGSEIGFSVRIVSGETFPVPVLVEYEIVRLVEDGEVYVAHGRLACRTLAALDGAVLRRVHHVPEHLSHRWQPGPHALVISVNGRRDALARWILVDGDGGETS